MKKLILVLAAVIGSQAHANSIWDYNVEKDLMEVTCYVGSGEYVQKAIVGQRTSARKPLELNAVWREATFNRQKVTVNKSLQVELVTISGHGPSKQVVIRGVQEGNKFDLSYFPNIGGGADLSVNGELKNYTSDGGLKCVGIFRKGSLE